MFYSDAEFMVKVNDKPGNVRFFRQKLRNFGKLQERQKLDDTHVDLFEKVKEYRSTYGCSWERGIDYIFSEAFPEAIQQPEDLIDSEPTDISLENNRLLKQLLQDVTAIKSHFNIG